VPSRSPSQCPPRRSEFLPHVFERFQQAETGTMRGHGGLGLGLSIVRHIVELHGGTIHVESPGSGQGATFTVKLPLVIFHRSAGELERRHPTIADEPGEHRYPALDGFRVLVVDDEPDSNDVVSTLLGSCGADVRSAGSAARALDVLASWRPDLVVTDIGMPGEDGYALRARMDERRDVLGRIPIIALTAYASTDDRVRLLAAGFRMHVTKPVEPAELVAAVANVGRASGKL
jgi:CheY-like chemotaxis protein